MAATRKNKTARVSVRLAACEVAFLDAIGGPRGRSETLALFLEATAIATSEAVANAIPIEERVAVVERHAIDERALVPLLRAGRTVNDVAARANALARLYAPGRHRAVPDFSEDAWELGTRMALFAAAGSVVGGELDNIAQRLAPPEQVPAVTVADPVDGTAVRLAAISPVGEGIERDAANVVVRLAPSQVRRLDEGCALCGVSRSSYMRMLLSAALRPAPEPSSLGQAFCYSRGAVARIEREMDIQLRNTAQIERAARRILAHEEREGIAGGCRYLIESTRDYVSEIKEYTMPALARITAVGEGMIAFGNC